MENPKNLIIVIFGASGDLASRKLIPAIFSLKMQKLMPEKYAIIGVGRTKITNEDFRNKMSEAIISFSEEKVTDKNLTTFFAENLYYFPLDSSSVEGFTELKSYLADISLKSGIGGNYIFYMATPPSLYELIAVNLSKVGLNDQEDGFRRLIIEKPFGYDLESGLKLNRKLH
jgi:glucose-6-phosphate 1-dehydrogenase